MKQILNESKEKMGKSIDSLAGDFSQLKAGRANPAVLDKITVEYYGAATPLAQIGSVSVPEAKTLLIQPWDTSVLGEIEKAILKSDIGINPINDGKQTPMKQVHPVFIAQHATGCCCRTCLEKIHNIKKGRKLTNEEINYIIDVLMLWIQREITN